MFYKIIYDNIIIDAILNPTWVIWTPKTKRFFPTDIVAANGVVSSDSQEVYHIQGKTEFGNRRELSRDVVVVKIEEDEYNHLIETMPNAVVDENGNEITIEDFATGVIEKMSQECEAKIISGFDITLSDQQPHHFTLELTDQLKISKLKDKAVSGEEFLPYHADNELCKIYSQSDIIAINTKMEYLIEYEVTYFNSLKNYINSITYARVLVKLKYGCAIPEEYQSDVLKILLAENEA